MLEVRESGDAILTARTYILASQVAYVQEWSLYGEASVGHSRASAVCPLPHPAPGPFSEYLFMPRLTSSLVCLENASKLRICAHFSRAFVISSLHLGRLGICHHHATFKFPASCVSKNWSPSPFFSPFLFSSTPFTIYLLFPGSP